MNNLSSLIYRSLKNGIKSIGPAVSMFSGSYLIYLGTKKKNFPLGFAGGYLIFNGGLKFGNLLQNNSFEDRDDGLERVGSKVSFVVNRPKNEVYTAWRNLSNLPRFIHHLSEVNEVDGSTSKWKLNIPGSKETIGWINKITKDKPYKRIEWKSDENGLFQSQGDISFKKIDSFSTKVNINYHYKFNPTFKPHMEELKTPLFEKLLESDLNNFKLYAENLLPAQDALK